MTRTYSTLLILSIVLLLLGVPFPRAILFSLSAPPPPPPMAVPLSNLTPTETQKLPDFSRRACKTKKTLTASNANINFLKKVSDEQFIAVGVIEKDTWTRWIGKFDSTLQPIWQYCYYSTRPEEDEINDLIITSDGGFLAVGKLSGEKWNAFAMKLDRDGKIEWQKGYTRPNDQRFGWAVLQSVVMVPSGGYLVSGYLWERLYDWGANCNACSGQYGLLMKLDANGAIEWQRTYGMEYEMKTPIPGVSNPDIRKKESVEGGFSFDQLVMTTE
ncbi:hypothetical protein HY624_03010, partial [Candidatus Uhrbacteria bacterium]|nr:hypothetical protein [Candidatus Uhrbacteria bacterium]